MRGQFIVGIQHIKCSANLFNGISIYDDLRIINDPTKAKCLRDPNFKELAGMIEVGYLRKSDLLVITDERDFPEINPELLISRILDFVRNFLALFWVEKDNSAYFDRGYLVTPSRVSSNTQTISYYNAEGGRADAIVSRRELETVKRLMRPQAQSVSDDFKIPEEDLIFKGEEGPAHRSISLPDRFMGFVHYSRLAKDLTLRIAMACSALEAVFSSTNTELSHRISERVAFLLADTPSKRKELYESVRTLYKIRSAFVHGDSISSRDTQDLGKHSRTADMILRQVAFLLHTPNKFAITAREGKEQLDKFHSSLLFGEIKESVGGRSTLTL